MREEEEERSAPREPMDDGEYQRTQDALVVVARLVEGLDLDGFLARIERADAVGAVIDPTLYRQAHGKLDDVRRLAEAVRGVQREARRQRSGADMAMGGRCA